MKTNQFLLVALFLGIMFTNCKNNEEETLTPPAATEFAALRQNFLTELTQNKTFDGAASFTFTSDKGVVVEINNLNLNGQPVTGNVQLRYIELFDIGRMALVNRPLFGRNYSGTKGPLVTGGEFFIDVTQNGEKLDGYANLQVPVSYTQGADPDNMSMWVIEDEEDTEWVQGGQGEMWRGSGSGANNYYQCWFPFCWTNIDWLYSLPGTQTSLRVRVPDGYNSGNCSVYAAYFDMPNTLAPFDIYDTSGKYFTEHTGVAPVGYKMFVIFVSGDTKTGKFVYATKLVTVENNQYVTFEASELRSGSIQQAINAINGLYN
jgi:hypothetical protein